MTSLGQHNSIIISINIRLTLSYEQFHIFPIKRLYIATTQKSKLVKTQKTSVNCNTNGSRA